MSSKTGIDRLDAELNHDVPHRPDPTSQRDVRYALASGFELNETLWMLDISDWRPSDAAAATELKIAERRDRVARR